MRPKLTHYLFVYLLAVILLAGRGKNQHTIIADNESLEISVVNSEQIFWQYTELKTGKTFSFEAPEFEIDGKLIPARMSSFQSMESPVTLKNGVKEYSLQGPLVELPDMVLRATFQVSAHNPIVRFRYELSSQLDHQLTKSTGHDQLSYLGVSLDGFPEVKEIRFSEFNEMVHSFCLSERTIGENHFADRIRLMGPLLMASDGTNSFLAGYEHGSQAPDHFLEFNLQPDHSLSLKAVKGN